MVKQRQHLHPGLVAHGDGVRRSRVPISGELAVFVGGVHGVVDDQIGAFAQANHRAGHGLELGLVGSAQLGVLQGRSRKKFLTKQDVGKGRRVGDVGHARAIGAMA
jgi:hypothetical protein